MRKQKLKHSKLRNTGLLYEFLVRQITFEVLNNTNKSKSAEIIKRVFSEKTELGKELSLYSILINKKFNSDKKANYFINEVMESRIKLNNPKLKREKYNLIKEIKNNYDTVKLFSSEIKNYKVYATIYKLFEYTEKLSPEQKTESFFNLMEHITTENDNLKLSDSVNKLTNDEDLRILTYQTLLEKFNNKYSKLNSAQKNLLRAYINNVSGTNSLKEHIQKVIPVVKKDIKKHSKNLKDEVVKIKLKEAIKSMNKFCNPGKTTLVNDNIVIQTMRYLELLKELKKSENKKQTVLK